MHPVRKAAEDSYKAALNACNTAMNGSSESVYLAAKESLRLAREAVVKTELEWPTTEEQKRFNHKKYLRNRGLDV